MILRYKGVERRKFVRVKVNYIIVCRLRRSVNVSLTCEHKDIDAIMVDLSEAGMALSVDQPVPTSTQFSIRFILVKIGPKTSSRYRPIELEGKVRSCVLVDKNRYRLGVSFSRISKQNKAAIINFMKGVVKNQ